MIITNNKTKLKEKKIKTKYFSNTSMTSMYKSYLYSACLIICSTNIIIAPNLNTENMTSIVDCTFFSYYYVIVECY